LFAEDLPHMGIEIGQRQTPCQPPSRPMQVAAGCVRRLDPIRVASIALQREARGRLRPTRPAWPRTWIPCYPHRTSRGKTRECGVHGRPCWLGLAVRIADWSFRELPSPSRHVLDTNGPLRSVWAIKHTTRQVVPMADLGRVFTQPYMHCPGQSLRPPVRRRHTRWSWRD
jgi:hypothetical protein